MNMSSRDSAPAASGLGGQTLEGVRCGADVGQGFTKGWRSGASAPELPCNQAAALLFTWAQTVLLCGSLGRGRLRG